MSGKQLKSEKKLAEQAVAKVREVVHNVSNDAIILALHQYDFDVERTVQAFCDGGAKSALETWAVSGSASNKKKSQKKKKNKTTPVFGTSAQKTVPEEINSVKSNEKVRPILNGNADSSSIQPQKLERTRSPPDIIAIPISNIEPSTVDAVQRNDPFIKNEILSETTDIANDDPLKDYGAEIEGIEVLFENEIAVASDNIRESFKCVRQILSERETHLLAELRRVQDEGARFFNERRVLSFELAERASRMGAMSDREQEELRAEIACFEAEKLTEEEIGRSQRFRCDNSQLIRLIKNFGEVVGVKGIVNGTASVARHAATVVPSQKPLIKHSASHSSIVSSTGEDSGFGQVSPLGNEEHKAAAEVPAGGIPLRSDELSAQELAELNKTVQEFLKLQGIDTSIVSVISSGNAPPPRRRPPANTRGGGGPGSRGRRGNTSIQGGRTQLVRVPDLSILQS